VALVSVTDELKPETLEELLAMSPEELGRVDIARMNLLSASGLPGAESIDIDGTIARIDTWARRVRVETERHRYRLTDPAYAAHYRNSEAYFCASFLLQVLQQDCGVRYRPGAALDPDFADSRDQFIHGLGDPNRGGTCASMPVLYAAVGRRLGYPIKLVSTRGHLFCRWDDGAVSLNIEGSGDGFSSFSDDYYRQWPYRLDAAALESGEYLASHAPAGELALFMAARGHCLMAVQSYAEAVEAYRAMARLAPHFRELGGFVGMAETGVRGGIEEVERLYGTEPVTEGDG
jgi:hypothetical protein